VTEYSVGQIIRLESLDQSICEQTVSVVTRTHTRAEPDENNYFFQFTFAFNKKNVTLEYFEIVFPSNSAYETDTYNDENP
jgi:guanylate kinase